MTSHDAMVRALAEEKSLEALVYLINHGREVEFQTGNICCFISRSPSKGFVSLWIQQEEHPFSSAEALVLDNEFLTAWKQADVETVY